MKSWLWVLWLLLLNAVLQLPWSLHDDFAPLRLVVPAGELVALLALVSVWPKVGGRLLAAGWLGLLIIELDRLIGVYLMGQDPLFYDQLFLVRHLLVLIADLWTPWWTASAVGIIATTVLTIVLLSKAVTSLRVLADHRAPLVALVLAAGLALLPAGWRPVRWITPELAENLRRSSIIWRGVRAAPQQSPYLDQDGIVLERRPDVQLYIVESYGRLLASNPETRDDWLLRMDELEGTLGDSGFHAASAWCTAPVSGGRSWLADGSLLTGIPIHHESVYRHLLDRIEPLPDLVEFFDEQGYRTVRVAPKDRARPGIELTNDLRFGQQIASVELDYRGPPQGWGWIPDQYSLGHIAESVLDGPPLFLLFHMVSSHVPWQPPPPILDDWRGLELLDGAEPPPGMNLSKQTFYQLRRYRRSEEVRLQRGARDALTVAAYAESIDYDLEVISRHLQQVPERDAIIVIMGDHQPPLVGGEATMDVPMHLLSRDPALLAPFLDSGFTPGLAIAPEAEAALRHEGFFSLLVRSLAQCCSDGPLPAYHPDGTPPHP
ncbi:MAG: hypothetical protein ACI8S6_002034 [Myxococcota bacterium]|jgi:hypothetical protein